LENKELELLERILRELQDIRVIVEENLECEKVEVKE